MDYDLHDVEQFLKDKGVGKHVWKAWRALKWRLEEAEELKQKVAAYDRCRAVLQELKETLDGL